MSGSRRLARHAQSGFALISGLLMLLVVTLLTVGMFRSFGLQEKIAGNTREKLRAFQAAQSALQYGESWLGNGNWGSGSNCAGTIANPVLASIQVCSNALSSVTTLPWSARVEYQPPTMSVAAGGGLNSNGDDINYYAAPGVYIGYLGLSSDSLSMLYSISAYGWGGSASTASVVQSTYAATTNPLKDLTAP